MGSIGVRGRAAALAAALTAIVGGSVAAPVAAVAEGEPVITWPTVTELNPTTTSYTVTTAYDGPEFLFLTKSAWGTFTVQRLPASGSRAVTFPADHDGPLSLTPMLCPAETYSAASCRQVGEIRTVHVYDELVPRLASRAKRGPDSTFGVEIQPAGGELVDVTWDVLPAGQPDAPPLVSGTASVVPATGELPPIGPSSALVDGQRYRYHATIAGTVEPYGQLQGTGWTEFTWDSHTAVTGFRFDTRDGFLNKTLRDVQVFYPLGDRFYDFRDGVGVVLLPEQGRDPISEVDITVRDLDLGVVRDMSGPGSAQHWDGRDQQGRVVPEGLYLVDVSVTDDADNEVTFQRKVEVSHERLVRTTWETTVRPKPYLLDKYVGRCASLRSPARPGWRGSFAFRSSTSCRRTSAQVVSTVYGIYLPRSPLGRYDRYDQVRITTYGGAPRGADRSYLVQWYWSAKDDEWIGRTQLPRQLGAHPGQEMGSRVVLGDASEESPFVIWSAGLAEGARYDVKSFTVHARYWDLR